MPATTAAAPVTIGVSLKMYFSHARTLEWAAAVADIARSHPAVRSGAVELFVVPTFPALVPVRAVIGDAPVTLGAQDLAWPDSGAFTGEVSGAELREIGVDLVEIAHAERRELFHETDDEIAGKVHAAFRNHLRPLICIGETERAADGDPAAAIAEVTAQLDRFTARATADGLAGPLIAAYEPVWAIGAPQPAPDEHIVGVLAGIEQHLATRQELAGSVAIYGGSAGPGLLNRPPMRPVPRPLRPRPRGDPHDPRRSRGAGRDAGRSTGVTSLLGLSTYAYFWRMSDRIPSPLSLDDALRDAATHDGVDLFQICDHLPLDTATDERLASIRSLAADLGLTLEVGTRGTRPEHLARYLHVAQQLGATLVRSMWTSGDDQPDAAETERRLRQALPAYERAGVTLALETYEVVATADLVAVVRAIGSDSLGICLDPANTVARLEHPADVVAMTAPHVVNWHVKDSAFTRSPGWVGFQYTGVPIGTGVLDHDAVRAALEPDTRGINRVIEFWLPWQDEHAGAEPLPGETPAQTTTRIEAAWTEHTIEYIRSKES
jgi:triosephosphate isomerase/sugar phosphate isomerase/epimerase